MITVEEALHIVERKATATHAQQTILLCDSAGCILAKDVMSPITMPPFPQSAMDGYAINCQNQNKPISLIGEVAAGQAQNFILEKNQAVRIFTGAEVPISANMVVRQEDVEEVNGKITVDVFPKEMANIRPLGEQIMENDLALAAGQSLNAASIGFLTSIGVEKVTVYKMPNIAIIATGSELVPVGKPLKAGQIYDSNSTMLKVALQQHGYLNTTLFKVEDNLDETVKTVANCLRDFDAIICSGGISVGDYDFIGKALEMNDVQTHFYKVKQKPGKPLYFGQKGDTYVFGLPGNPAACLTGFNIYILPLLNKLKGGQFVGLTFSTAKLAKSYSRKGDRAEFLKGKINGEFIEILEGQSSAMLKSFAMANALIYIPIDCLSFQANDWVNYYALE